MPKQFSRRELIGRLGLAGGAAAWATGASARPRETPPASNLPVFDVRAYGAKADGAALNTSAIQAAIDACGAAGGGAVFFPPGRFLTGGLLLRSRVTLQTSPGTWILGSTRLEDYPVHHPKLASRTRAYVQHALVYGEDLDQVGIVGPGIFDGQGAEFRKLAGEEYLKRPYLVRLVECRDVRMESVTLNNSAMWTAHFLACRRARIDGVRIWAHAGVNNDGLDIDASEDVLISNCWLDTDDDALVLKSTLRRPSRNITVTNCVLASHCNAFKMGTESLGGFINVTLSNCVIQSPPASESINGRPRGIAAIALESVDGADVERIAVSNVVIQGYEAAIFLRLGDRGAVVEATDPKPAAGHYRGVSISHVIGEEIGRTGCSLTGIPDYPLRDVSLEDISLRFGGGGTREEAGRLDVPENSERYPEATMFGILPAYGFYARHARNLRLRNLDLGFAKDDARPPLVLEDIERLEIAGLSAQTGPQTDCLVRLRQVRDAFIHGCRADGPLSRPADMDDGCKDIRFEANAFDAPGAAKK